MAFPRAQGLIVDEPNDRLIVRVHDYGPYEIWWTYRLSTGAVLEKRTPKRWLAGQDWLHEIYDAKLVQGTPLILLHWSRFDATSAWGAQFYLVDAEAKPVWTLERPGDYTLPQDQSVQTALREWVGAHGGILRADQPRRFDLFFAADEKRVSFAVSQKPTGEWQVAEVGRALFSFSNYSAPYSSAAPERTLRALQPLELGGNDIVRVSGMAVDREGRIYAVDYRTGCVHVFDPTGRSLHVCRTKPTDFKREVRWPALTINDQGDVFLGLGEGWPPDEPRSFAHFSANGTRQPDVVLPAGRCQFQPGSGALFLMGLSDVDMVDQLGKRIRTLDRRPDGESLEHPESIAFAPDGSLVILASRTNRREVTANLYKPNGDPVRTILIVDRIGRLPPTAYDGRRLIAATDAALLVFDNEGTPIARCDPPPEVADGRYYYPFLLPGTNQLALFDGRKPVLHSYELP